MSGFDFQPSLTGDLVSMRPMVEADFEPLFAIASDPLIWKVHPFHTRWQRDVFRSYVDQAFADQGGLIASDAASGAMIGFSRYSQTKVGPDEIEIGWTFLSRSVWGGAHNRDMKRIMIGHALEHFPRVIFRIGAENIRSRRAMEKIGGTQIAWDEAPNIMGRKVPHVAYEITRTAFATGPLTLRR
jgi:N-acetyltransferase